MTPEQRVVWFTDNQVGDCLQVVREGDRYWFVLTDMESGAAWHVFAVVDWPKSGEPQPMVYAGAAIDVLMEHNL